MDEDDYLDLMRYTQEHLQRAGMGGLLERITVDIGGERTPPSQLLLRMLDRLDSELRREAAGTADRILRVFAEIASTEDGAPPAGLWLDLAPEHRDMYGIDGIDLRERARLDPVLEEIDYLRRELIEDLEGPRGPRA